MADDSGRESHQSEGVVEKPTSEEEVVVPFASRRLQSSPLPSLEVIVGPEQKLYRYHGLVLALQSSYVDVLLSSPAATALQETQKISFPDIPISTWEKMMTLLAPGGGTTTTGGRRGLVFNGPTILEVLPFYDKYQFMDGIRLCDQSFQKYFEAGLYNDDYFSDVRLVFELKTSMMVMSVELNLPLSKESALKLAQKRVRKMMYPLEEDLQRLLPLVENDAPTLRSLAYILYGRKAKTMSVDDMRMQAREEGFAARIIKQRKALQTIDQKVLRPLLLSAYSSDTELYLTTPSEMTTQGDDEIPKYYQRVHNTRVLDEEVAGVMKYVYIPKTNNYGDQRISFAIEAKDVFGNEWELVKYTKDEENEERAVLYVWDGGYSSYVAPEHGWVLASSP